MAKSINVRISLVHWVEQAFGYLVEPCGQLAEDHAQHLVLTGKVPDVSVATTFHYDKVEWELGKLRKNISALVRRFFLQKPASQFKSSRHQKTPQICYKKNFKELGLTFSTH